MIRFVFCVISILSLCSTSFSSQWIKNFGTTEIYTTIASDVYDDGIIVAGNISPTLLPTKKTAFLLKIDQNGSVNWHKIYYGNNEYIYSVKRTMDNGFIVAGKASGSIWIAKLDDKGNIQWQNLYGSSKPNTTSYILETSDGGYLVLYTANSSNGNSDLCILRLDSNGNILWQKGYDSGEEEEALSVVSISDGYVVVGRKKGINSFLFLMKIDFSGNVKWSKVYNIEFSNISYVKRTVNENLIVIGSFYRYEDSYANSDIFIVKFDKNGNILWQKAIDKTAFDYGSDIVEDGDGYIAVGRVQIKDNIDILAVKLDNNGNILWNKLYGGSRTDSPVSIHKTIDGLFIVGGSNSFSFISDVLIVKTDKSGNIPNCSRVYETNVSMYDLEINSSDVNFYAYDTYISAKTLSTMVSDKLIDHSFVCIYDLKSETEISDTSGNGGGCSTNSTSSFMVYVFVVILTFMYRKLLPLIRQGQ